MAGYFRSITRSLLVTGLILANVYAEISDRDNSRGSRSLTHGGTSMAVDALMRLEVKTAIKYGDIGYLKKFAEDNQDTKPAALGLKERSWDEVLRELINAPQSGDSYSADSYLARIEAKRLLVREALDRGDMDFMKELSKIGKDPSHFGLKGSWDKVIQEMQEKRDARAVVEPLKE